MSANKIAKRYASALMDVCGSESSRSRSFSTSSYRVGSFGKNGSQLPCEPRINQ